MDKTIKQILKTLKITIEETAEDRPEIGVGCLLDLSAGQVRKLFSYIKELNTKLIFKKKELLVLTEEFARISSENMLLKDKRMKHD